MTIGTRIKGSRPVRALGKRAVAALDERERKQSAEGRTPPARTKGVWALSQLGLLDVVPEPDLLALAPGARVRTLPRRQAALVDETDGRVWVVLDGGAKLSRIGAAGQRFVEAILGPGDVFGRISEGADRAAYEVQALEATRVVAVPRAGFEALLRRHPDLAYCVVQVLEDRQRRLVRRVEALVFKDVRGRVVETLLDLCREHGQPCQHGFAIDVRITQQDLADLVGASRQMINRVLGELSRRLYVQRMGRVLCVLNRDRLQRLAGEPVE